MNLFKFTNGPLVFKQVTHGPLLSDDLKTHLYAFISDLLNIWTWNKTVSWKCYLHWNLLSDIRVIFSGIVAEVFIPLDCAHLEVSDASTENLYTLLVWGCFIIPSNLWNLKDNNLYCHAWFPLSMFLISCVINILFSSIN